MYLTTASKITHIMDEHASSDPGGYFKTVCGLWARPKSITPDKPDGCRKCKQCYKKDEP